MKNMQIRVQGNKIELCRYGVKYMVQEQEYTFFTPIREEADHLAEQYDGVVEILDTMADEWIDGLELPKTNMPMEAANEIAAMGEEGYKKWLEQQAAQSPEKLAEENEKLKQQLTDTQLALVEVYEMILPS